MKKELKKAAQTGQTVENANETENQVINETATTETTENGETIPTAETEAQKAEAQKAETIEELQQRLDVELARLNFKKRLARHRETFINSMGSLQLFIDQLTNENDFETKSGKIVFKVLDTDHYDRTSFIDTFTISNTELINKFCNLLYSEMKQKKTELETQLLTA
jgi:hypothetical protein